MFKQILFLSVFILSLSASILFAVEKPEATRLDEIVVTATRLESSVKELPVAVTVISRKDIEQSRSQNLTDLLTEKLPGHYHKYPGALSSVEIRGFRSDTTGADIKGRVAILIDGHRAGTGNIAVIPLENVERVEIVRGPGSVIYGSAAMGGVINIITRRGKGKPSVNAGIEYGTWEHVKKTAGVSGGLLDDRIGISLTARNVKVQDYDSGDGKKFENTRYNDEAYAMSLLASPFPNHSFFATGHFYRGWDIGLPNPTYDALKSVDYKDAKRGYGSIAYDGKLSAGEISWHLSYNNVYDRSTWNSPAASWGYDSSTTETSTQGIRSHITFPTFSFGKLLVGFDWDNIDVTGFTKPSGFVYNPNSSYDNYAVLAEEKIDLGKLSFLLGLRYDYFKENIKTTENLAVVPKEEKFDHLSWRAGTKYFMIDWLSARAAVGTGFRVPAADELAGRFSQTMLRIVGNPNLKPESSITYEVGLDSEYAGLTTGLGFFHTKYTDRITGGFSACVGGDCTWRTYGNVDGGTFSGIEGSLEYKIPLSWQGNKLVITPFTDFIYYTQRKIDDQRYAMTLGSDVMPYISRYNLTGGIKMGLNETVNLQITSAYNGPQVIQDWSDWMSPTYGMAIDKKEFTTYAARLSVKPMKYFSVYLAVDNLTNEFYEFVQGFPMPGRALRLGIEGNF